MPSKRTPIKEKKPAARKIKGDGRVLNSAERLAKLLQESHARGAGPFTEQELEKLIEENRQLWPQEKEIDEFIAWLHHCRREGRYI
jgi:hypothetical protein